MHLLHVRFPSISFFSPRDRFVFRLPRAFSPVSAPTTTSPCKTPTVTNGQVVNQQANLTLTAQNNYLIQSGANVTFRAGTWVKLAAGFTASNGSTFHGMIDFNQNGIPDYQEELTAASLALLDRFRERRRLQPRQPQQSRRLVWRAGRADARELRRL